MWYVEYNYGGATYGAIVYDDHEYHPQFVRKIKIPKQFWDLNATQIFDYFQKGIKPRIKLC
jgi:hypothetical protein